MHFYLRNTKTHKEELCYGKRSSSDSVVRTTAYTAGRMTAGLTRKRARTQPSDSTTAFWGVLWESWKERERTFHFGVL